MIRKDLDHQGQDEAPFHLPTMVRKYTVIS